LGFTLHVHETLLALTLHVYFFEDLIDFFLFVTVLVFRALSSFAGHLLSDEILLAVRECEREGITSGNGKGMGFEKDIPAHIYSTLN